MHLPDLVAALVASLVLAGCAAGPKIIDIQASCEARFARFEDAVGCLQREVAADPRPKDHRVRLYLAAADDMARRVAAGSMAATEAKVHLLRLYAELRDQRRRERAEADATFDRALQRYYESLPQPAPAPTRPREMDCQPVLGAYPPRMECRER